MLGDSLKPLNINKDKLIRYAAPFIFFLGGVLIFIFFGLPGVPKISSLRTQNSQKETRLVKLRDKSKRLADLLAFKTNLEEDKDVFEFAVPSESEVPTFMTQIEDVARESNVGLIALQFGGESTSKDEKEAPKIKLSVSVSGSFRDIRTFLKNLERSSRIVVVDSIRFGVGLSNEPDSELLTANISLYSYYISDIPEVGSDMPISLDLDSSEFIEVLGKVKELKVYSREVDPTGVGKEDPFAR